MLWLGKGGSHFVPRRAPPSPKLKDEVLFTCIDGPTRVVRSELHGFCARHVLRAFVFTPRGLVTNAAAAAAGGWGLLRSLCALERGFAFIWCLVTGCVRFVNCEGAEPHSQGTKLTQAPPPLPPQCTN